MKKETLQLITQNLTLAQETLRQARKHKLDNHLPHLQIEKSCLKDIEVLMGLVKQTPSLRSRCISGEAIPLR